MGDSLLTGLVDYLESQADVRDVKLTCKKPISVDEISSWERLHHCALPDDLRLFYLSNNGVLLQWSYQYNDALLQLGRININSLDKMEPLHIEEGSTLPRDIPSVMDLGLSRGGGSDEEWQPSFQGSCKIFSLDHCITCGHICLVYNTDEDAVQECSIWLLDLSLCWHYLCSSFSDVLRLAVVHIGLFQWPYALTRYGPSPQYERWLHMFVPKRFEEDMTYISQSHHHHHHSHLHDHQHQHSEGTAINKKTDSPSHLSQSSVSFNNFDVSKVLYSKSFRDRRSKVDPVFAPKKTQFPSK